MPKVTWPCRGIREGCGRGGLCEKGLGSLCHIRTGFINKTQWGGDALGGPNRNGKCEVRGGETKEEKESKGETLQGGKQTVDQSRDSS